MTTVNAKPFPEMGTAMTLRDYFAAQAMQALIQKYDCETCVFTAMEAYEYADAMLKKRAE
jgi:hypothetical protein